MNHVKQNHWNLYRCPSLCDLKFPSISECKDHVVQSHPDVGTPTEIDALIKLSAQPLDIRAGLPCPLCGETLNSDRKYQHHVGRHQEQLALFALPDLESNDESGHRMPMTPDFTITGSNQLPQHLTAAINMNYKTSFLTARAAITLGNAWEVCPPITHAPHDPISLITPRYWIQGLNISSIFFGIQGMDTSLYILPDDALAPVGAGIIVGQSMMEMMISNRRVEIKRK